MQFIDLAIETITILSVVFFSVQFVSGLTRRQRPAPVQATPAPAAQQATIEADVEADVKADVEAVMEIIKAFTERTAELPAIPFEEPIEEPTPVPLASLDPELASVTLGPTRSAAKHIRHTIPKPPQPSAVELRRQCQAEGIKWRNARGHGQHLSKKEMIRALAARKA